MALVFPTPAQAAAQTPVNTFSPTSSPLANTSNSSTYTYDPVRGVWLTSGGGASAGAMPCSGGTFTGPVNFNNPTLFCGTASFCCNTAFACTATFDDTVVCGTALNCGDTITCGDQYIYGTTYNCGNVVNTGTVTNCALVINCADTCTYGTAYHIGNTVTCGTVTNCGNVVNCGTVTNCGNTVFCGTITNCANTVNCGTVTNCGNTVNRGTVTNCALVQNCADVCNYGTTYNIGNTVTCGDSLFCGDVAVCGTTTNYGDIYNCGTTFNVGDVVTCGTALFCGNVETCGTVTNNGTVTNVSDVITCGTTTNCGPTIFCDTATFNCAATFCQPVTFCSTPILPPGTALGCAACITYSNTTSGLSATNVQAALDELALPPPVATAAVLGVVCIGSNVQVTAAGQISILNASTTQSGVVQLYNGVDSTSTTQALTAAQGLALQTQIDSLSSAGGLTLAGTYDGSTGQMVTVTTAGAGQGFTVGSPYPAAAAGNTDFYVIVTTAGGGANKGDWYLSDGTAWSLLGVGFVAPNASTTVSGLVELSTNAETQAGTNASLAVTPASLQSKVSDSTSTTSSTAIASSTAVKSAYDLANAAIPCATITAKGALIAGTGASTFSALPVGASGQVLSANPTAATGLSWINLPSGTLTGISVTLPLTSDVTNPAVPALAINKATTVAVGVVSVGTNINVNGAGQISVPFASTSGAGVVELYDNLDSTSVTEALTAAQGKVLQDQINALSVSGGLTLAGTFNGSTGVMATVTTAGSGAGFVVGSPRPAAAVSNKNFYVIVTTAGGGATKGDWYLSNGTVWQLLDVGFDAPYASTTVPGLVQLSTNAQTQTGTDNTLAVTPQTLQSKVSDATNLTSSTTIASSTAVKNAYNLAADAIPKSTITAKGNIIVGTGSGTYVSVPVGGNGEVLSADSTQASGVRWIPMSSGGGGVSSVTGTAPIIINNTTPSAPVVTIQNGTTSQLGAVQLYNNVDSTSTTLALTAAQGKSLQDQISALSLTSNLTLAGTFNASTGKMVTVTTAGTSAGFAVNSNLPAATTGNAEHFVIVTTSGSYTPPGGVSVDATVGDWFLSTGTAWQYLNVGPQVPAASTTEAGIVELATNAEVQAASSTTLAITPSGLASNVSDSTSTTSSTQIASSTAVKSAYDLANAAIPKSTLANKGDIITATASSTPVALTVGTNNQVLAADSTCSSGLKWITPCSGTVTSVTAGTGLSGGTITGTGTINLDNTAVTAGSYTYASFTVDAQGRLTAASSGAAPVPLTAFDAKGDLLAGSGSDAYVTLTVGTDGQVLTADSACASGLKWAAASGGSGIPCSCITGKGALVTGTAASTPTALAVGTDGQVLVACSAATNGICWTTVSGFGAATPSDLGTVFARTTCYVTGGTTPSTGVTALGHLAYSGLGAGVARSVLLGNYAGCALGVGCAPSTSDTTVIIGFNAARTAVVSLDNVVIGALAADSCTNIGGGNIVIGAAAASQISSPATNNTVVGTSSGNSLTTGCSNVLLGTNAANNLTTGSQNVAIGPNVNVGATLSCNLAIGFANNQYWLTGNSTKAIKPGAGIIDCAGSCGTAGQALLSNGANAVCWGSPALASANSTTLGAVYGCTTCCTGDVSGVANVALGNLALQNSGDVRCSVVIGYAAGNKLGSAATVCCANRSVLIGGLVGANAVCSKWNVLIGQQVGSQVTAVDLGAQNTIVGGLAASGLNGGTFNVGLGYGALNLLTTGNYNVAIGPSAGNSLTTQSNNVILGYYSGGGPDCSLFIGYAGNRLWLSGCSDGSIKPAKGIVDDLASTGTVGQYLWTTGANGIRWASSSPSDIRDKEIVGDVPTALPVINRIEPISYHWKDRETGETQEELIYGFSAQQLQEVDPVLVDAQDEEHLRIHDRKIVPLLVQAVRELSAEVKSLRDEIYEIKNK